MRLIARAPLAEPTLRDEAGHDSVKGRGRTSPSA